MGCNNQGLVITIVDISTPSWVRGADCFVTTQVSYQGDRFGPPGSDSLKPYTFQTLVGSTAYFPADTGVVGPIAAVGTLVSNDLGQTKFIVPSTASTGLAVGDQISFEQVVQDARGTTILIYDNLSVVDQLFP